MSQMMQTRNLCGERDFVCLFGLKYVETVGICAFGTMKKTKRSFINFNEFNLNS